MKRGRPTKEAQIAALRIGRAARYESASLTKPVTKREANFVTLPERPMTGAEIKKHIGRPKVHASTAAKQRAYRARRQGNA